MIVNQGGLSERKTQALVHATHYLAAGTLQVEHPASVMGRPVMDYIGESSDDIDADATRVSAESVGGRRITVATLVRQSDMLWLISTGGTQLRGPAHRHCSIDHRGDGGLGREPNFNGQMAARPGKLSTRIQCGTTTEKGRAAGKTTKAIGHSGSIAEHNPNPFTIELKTFGNDGAKKIYRTAADLNFT